MRKLLLCLLMCLALAATGCRTAKIYNVPNHQSPTAVSLAEMKAAILEGGQAAGWNMAEIEPGLIEATLLLKRGKHMAVADVTYTAKAYSIIYKSSDNLKADGKGKIHKNYNVYVEMLDNNIQAKLNAK